MSQGSWPAGSNCPTNNFGDPVVVYDSFTDHWIINDFAFTLDGSGNPILPMQQCFAVSKSGDPVGGGWNFYSMTISDFFADYPKLGIWPDGLYMSANMFSSGGAYSHVRAWALNKAQMEAGAPTAQIVAFDLLDSTYFTALPSNARAQTGTPPDGRPNFFEAVGIFSNGVSTFQFHVDWNNTANSTFTGPAQSSTPTAIAAPPASVPESGGNNLDTLRLRSMVQNQYSNIAGVESLWDSDTVAGSGASQASPRYYQIDVTGGTVGATAMQAFTYNPDTTVSRFMPSVEVDRQGNMALGYSASNSATFPAIEYTGRLATDPANSLTLGENTMISGTGSQSGNCGSSACIRWGDYSSMTLDPDGCTFWYTNMYYASTGLDWQTRIGSFTLPGADCAPIANGTLQGTVTDTGANPISGATVTAGFHTATTGAGGTYSFPSITAGSYTVSVSAAGFSSGSASATVTGSSSTTQDFTLSQAPASGCYTTPASGDDYSNCWNSNTAASVGPAGTESLLLPPPGVDQENTNVSNIGNAITTTSWQAQTFQAGVSGLLTEVDLDLFCSSCSGADPAVTVELRDVSGTAPGSTILATTTIPGFSSGSGGFFQAAFGSPFTVTAGTSYAIVVHLVTNRTTGLYAATRSASNTYANGARNSSANGGATWTAQTTDLGFITYVATGYDTSGTVTSSLKDANPISGSTAKWMKSDGSASLTWTATTPSRTAVEFQVAGSNSPTGPFTFVGADGTSDTFFTTSPASLSPQFDGMRYLKWESYLSTTDTSVTPTLSQVQVCFKNTGPTAARVTGARVVRAGAGRRTSLTFMWRLAIAGGVAGFRLYAGDRPLTRHLIPVHRSRAYRYHLVSSRRVRRLSLGVVLTNGLTERIRLR
jgi:hypothetical protein